MAKGGSELTRVSKRLDLTSLMSELYFLMCVQVATCSWTGVYLSLQCALVTGR